MPRQVPYQKGSQINSHRSSYKSINFPNSEKKAELPYKTHLLQQMRGDDYPLKTSMLNQSQKLKIDDIDIVEIKEQHNSFDKEEDK